MPTRPLTPVLRYLAKLRSVAESAQLSDGELLARFAARNDEAAFATLVRRHGPMVLAVCRRLLRDVHDAEDAFQATFLLLLRKSASLRQPERLGPWLHGVAYRTALKARCLAYKRRDREKTVADVAAADGNNDLLWRDLGPILDEAIRQLPGKYRTPFVLCHLEGLTHAQAARQLGCPPGTIATRLSRARERLRVRLTKQGVTLSAAALVAALAENASATPVPLNLAQTVVHLASILGTTKAVGAGAISSQVAAITEGVGKAMFMEKLKVLGLAVAMIVGTIGVGTGALVIHAQAQQPVAVRQPQPEPPRQVENPKEDDVRDVVVQVDENKSGSLLFGVGVNSDAGRTAVLQQPKPPEPEPKNRMPRGAAPITALAVLDGEGRLVVRIPGNSCYYRPRTTYQQRPDGGTSAISAYELVNREEVRLVQLKDLHAFSVDGKRIETNLLAERLKKEIPVLISADGQHVDAFHLQLIKEGTLVLVLPTEATYQPAPPVNATIAYPAPFAVPPQVGEPPTIPQGK